MKNLLLLTLTVATVMGASFIGISQVTTGADDGSPGTLRAQIAAAAPGATITIDATVSEINITSPINIDKSLRLTTQTIITRTPIDANGSGRIFEITAGPVTLENLVLRDGTADNGGAILVTNTALMVENCTFVNNIANGTSGSGGAILVDAAASLNVSNSTFNANLANRAGGAIEVVSGSNTGLTATNVIFTDNKAGVNPATPAPGNGGAIHITGAADAFITGGSATNNQAALEGGAFWNGSGSMTIDGTTISNNLAFGNGANEGGGGLFNAGGTLSVNNATMNANVVSGTSASGGAILSDQGDLFVSNTTISSNTAVRAGGGIEFNSTAGDSLALVNVSLSSNSTGSNPGNGGGLHITGAGNSFISGGTVSMNTASLEGGGLWNGSGTMTIDGTSISANIASGANANEGGGGVFNAGGTLIIENAIFEDNEANGSSGSGGGILNDLGTITVLSTSFDGNTAVRAGGAIEDNSNAGATATYESILMSNNSVSLNPGNGGGLHVSGSGNSIITEITAANNSASAEGGALWNGSGTMTLFKASFGGNVAAGAGADQGGGAVFNAGGTLEIDSATFVNNEATGSAGSGGAILNDLGILTVTNAEFSSNTAVRAGGAIEDNSNGSATLNLENISFVSNVAASAPGNGGALHITGSSNSNLSNISAELNTAAREGGALWNGSGTMNISGLIAIDNEAEGDAADDGGGALFNNGGNVTLTGNVEFDGNIASGTSGSGGAVLSTDGTIDITGASFEGNAANRAGGAIEIRDGELNLTNTLFTSNTVDGTVGIPNPGSGGAIHITGNSTITTINDSEFTTNSAALTGGALWNQNGSTMTVVNTSIDANTAAGGGGAYNTGGTLSFEGSTLSNNVSSDVNGGGAILNASGSLNLERSTISGNTSAGNGGGLENNGSATLNAVTVAFNSAQGSGGGIDGASSVTITNTLVTENSASTNADVSGNITSGDFNLISDNSAGVFVVAPGDLVVADAKIDVLADNGGGTQTHALQEGSAAIDAGNSSTLFLDQRGMAIVGTRDIGSYESQALAGINENELSTTKLYPNPTTKAFAVEFASPSQEIIQLKMVDMTGKTVYSEVYPVGTTRMELTHNQEGLYIIHLSSGNMNQSHRVQIVK